MFDQKIFDNEIAKGRDFDSAFVSATKELRKQIYDRYTREVTNKRKNELCEIAAEAYARWLLEEFKDDIHFEDFEDFLCHAREDIYYLRNMIRK